MEINQYISKREYNFLLILTFTLMFFFLSLFIYEAVKGFNDYVEEHHNKLEKLANQEPIIQFSGGGNINQIPGFHLLTLFIFISLLKTKRFILPLLLTFLYAFAFICGLYLRFNAGRLGGEEFSPEVAVHERIIRAANAGDYIILLVISILLFWQISILLRMLIKTLQRKIALP